MLLLPTEGKITQKFHTKVSYIKGRNKHEAVDIVTYGPRPLKTLHAGTPTKVIDKYDENKKTGYGNEVWIKYETGVEDRYCHCAKGILVKVGQQLEAGQEFAHTGRTGYRKPESTWHTHWESHLNGKRVDPLTSLNQLTKESMEKYDNYIKQTDGRLNELEEQVRLLTGVTQKKAKIDKNQNKKLERLKNRKWGRTKVKRAVKNLKDKLTKK